MWKEGENEEGGGGGGGGRRGRMRNEEGGGGGAPAVYCTQINCIMIPDPERGKNCTCK